MSWNKEQCVKCGKWCYALASSYAHGKDYYCNECNNRKEVKLPKLPKPSYTVSGYSTQNYFTEDQMKQYAIETVQENK